MTHMATPKSTSNKPITAKEIEVILRGALESARATMAPVPETFGIDESQLPALRAGRKKATRDQREQHVVCVTMSAFGLLIAGGAIWSWWVWWLAFFPGTWVIMVWLVEALNELRPLRGYELLESYEEAVAAWESNIERSRRVFWENLPDGYAFEVELGQLYEKAGYTVEVTRKSGDGGVDIWLRRQGESAIVQCKHHKSRVGVADARELLFLRDDHRVDKAVLASVSGFTSGVRKLARRHPLELVDLDDIIAMHRQHMKFVTSS